MVHGKIMKIAITGKIGSGKSEITKILRANGAFVVSADDMNKRLLSDKVYLSVLKKHFPEAFNSDEFDKKTLTRIVFSDAKKRNLLNSLAHPEIFRLIKDEIKDKKDAFVEVPLLSREQAKNFDMVWFVSATEDERIKRVEKRDGREKEEIQKIFLAQSDIDAKLYDNAVLIQNDGDIDKLSEKVIKLYQNVIIGK